MLSKVYYLYCYRVLDTSRRLSMGAQSSNAFTNFAASQTWSFDSNEWGLSCRYRYNTGEWGCSNWFFGPFTVTFALPFGEWSAYYAYADSLGWTEVAYVQDVRLR